MLTYNTQAIHTFTKETPENARNSEESIDVKTNVELRALNNRKYPPSAIGDHFKILRKCSPMRKSACLDGVQKYLV